ncbi:4Fe-4S dicluster domain-containing protein [Saccharicrinis sp. FJH54]|uniref:4Fe-4S dicluster domain-containing protein n=1 Tax=Saccharicrinis sp. FJH54 TaxID=3344665 RepID=UPI0035D4B274
MNLNRRNFLKVLGVTGVAVTTGEKLVANTKPGETTELHGILYDISRCKGCCGCEIDCADANGLPYPEDGAELGVVRKTSEIQRTVVNAKQTSKGKMFVRTQCMNCNDPACCTACLTEAMHKTEVGPVIWRGDKCMGCRYCMVSCPFDMPKFEYKSTNPVIQKCTMCYELIEQGEVPNCVYNCPYDALKYGTRRELLSEAHKRIAENPDVYIDQIYGEHEAGGTGWLYISPVPFEELGLKTNLQKSSYPALTKGFISSIAPVDILLPGLLIGIHEAVKFRNQNNKEE